MKKVLAEVCRIFKKAPVHISIILLMDIACAIIYASDPYIIGVCIDDLMAHEYRWLFIFIALHLLLIALRTADKFLDTRTYSRIVAEESAAYYEKIIRTNANESKISSLLDLVDDVPNFLEADLFNILSMTGGMAFSLAFILSTSGLFVFALAVSVSAIVPIATYKLAKDIAFNNGKRKHIDEARVNIIASRRIGKYRKHLKKALSLDVVNSDLDAKAYLITDLLQAALLVAAIVSTIHVGSYTSGQLFSTITYVMTLNDHASEINETIIVVKNVQDSVSRLERNIK